MKTIKQMWWLTLLRGLILLALAFYVFTQPISALISIAIYIGISLLFTGIGQTIMAIASRNDDEKWIWSLTGGLIEIFFAFILLSYPAMTAASLSLIVGFWIMVFGIMTFANSFQSKKEGLSNWWLGLISGIFNVIIGYIISNNIVIGSIAITIWIGFGFLVAGFVNINLALAIRSLKSH